MQLGDGAALKEIMDAFETATNLNFTMITKEATTTITPQILGIALGYLSHRGVDTLITPMVDTNWANPTTYKFFMDQNTLFYTKSYYTDNAFNTIHDAYLRSTLDLMKRYAQVVGIVSFCLCFCKLNNVFGITNRAPENFFRLSLRFTKQHNYSPKNGAEGQ